MGGRIAKAEAQVPMDFVCMQLSEESTISSIDVDAGMDETRLNQRSQDAIAYTAEPRAAAEAKLGGLAMHSLKCTEEDETPTILNLLPWANTVPQPQRTTHPNSHPSTST